MIAVSGAAGHLGRMTALAAVEFGCRPDELVLATRTPDAIDDFIPGARVRYADFDKPESLRDAFAGVRRLLLISTDAVDRRSRQHAAAIDAAVEAGVEHVIYTSMLSPAAPNPALIAESHWATEQHLRASGIAFTVLRCSFYADFQVFEAAEALSTGRFVHNRGSGGCSYIAREDCARAAAAVLTGEGHEGMQYELTGPESLDADALAELYSSFGDREVVAVSVSDDELLSHLDAEAGSDGHAQYGAALALSLGKAIRLGRCEAVSSTVAELTGSQPRTVGSLLTAHKRALRSGGERA